MSFERIRTFSMLCARFALPLGLGGMLAACDAPTQPAGEPAGLLAVNGQPIAAREGPGADVLQGDFALAVTDAAALASTCPSNPFAGNGWAVVFGHSECLIATPLWASTTYEPYPLRDDVAVTAVYD